MNISLDQFCDAYKKHIEARIEEFRGALSDTAVNHPLFTYEKWEALMFDFFTEEPDTPDDEDLEEVEEVVVGEELEEA